MGKSISKILRVRIRVAISTLWTMLKLVAGILNLVAGLSRWSSTYASCPTMALFQKDGYLAGWGDDFLGCAERSGQCLDTQITMKEVIDKAGFTDIQERLYKCPIGGWPKDVVLKEAGKINKAHWSSELESWAMWLPTKHGKPEPSPADEARVHVAKVRQELQDPKLHIYHLTWVTSLLLF
jgi:hypothetical protein